MSETLLRTISEHSSAYAELLNLLDLLNWSEMSPVNKFLMKKTCLRLIPYTWPQERQAAIMKIRGVNWK